MICLRQIYPLSSCASGALFCNLRRSRYHYPLNPLNPMNLLNLHTEGVSNEPSRRRRVHTLSVKFYSVGEFFQKQ